MKQHITKEQWDELNDEQKDKFLLTINIILKSTAMGLTELPRQGRRVNGILPTIGEMIEFLGDNWERQAMEQSDGMDSEALLPKNICNSCWETVKYELR